MLRTRHALLFFCALMFSSQVVISTALAESVSLTDVIRTTFANHPDIRLGELNPAFAQAEQERISGMLDPRLSARVGASDEKSPTTSPFAANQTKSTQFSGAVVQPLSDGSTLTGSLNYNRTRLNYPAAVPTTFQSTLNPIYSHQIDLTYRYPLLRGHGNPAYHDLLDAATKDEHSAKWQVEMLKEGLAGEAIGLYYKLAMEELSLNIANDAVSRARKLLKYQRSREQFGLIEKADRLQAEALLATRRMEKSANESAIAQARTALNRLMLRKSEQSISPHSNEPVIDQATLAALNVDQVLATATANRAIFKSLQAQLDAATARLNVAKDQHDTQIDLVGQVGSRALEDKAGRAFSKGFSLTDRFISVSVELSDTFNGGSTHSEIRKAELARQKAMLEQIQAKESITTQISTLLNQLSYGTETLKAAEQRVAAETKKFNAEMERYREGRSNTAVIVQFEGELRMAELQAALQRISLQMASQQLKLTEGTLLSQLGTTSATEPVAKDNP